MGNQIKQQQLDLFADRTSCQVWWANQFRMWLSGLAYILLESIRRPVLKNTNVAHACLDTIRLMLLKTGAVILSKTRRIRFQLFCAYPYQALFRSVVAHLAPD